MITFNRNSWHCRLATVFNPANTFSDVARYHDLCSYSRGVLAGFMFVVVIIVFLGIVVAFPIGNFLAWIAAMVSEWAYLTPTPESKILPHFSAVVAVAFCGYKLKVLIGKYFSNRKEQKAVNSFIGEAYKSFKERTCVRITIK